MSDDIIGIDLGTTNSCVAAWINGKIEIIQDQDGKRLTPSFLTFLDDIPLVGKIAQKYSATKPLAAVYEFKRLMGQYYDNPRVQRDIETFFYEVYNDMGMPKIKVPIDYYSKEYHPEELSAFIIGRMKEIAEIRLGYEVRRAVVTIPAYFNDSQRQATIDAGRIAGFRQVNIINEPTAAALAYAYVNSLKFTGNLLVYDFGGGTFDVSVVYIKDGFCTVKATDGNDHLGGKEITAAIYNHILHSSKISVADEDFAVVARRLHAKCDSAKKELSILPVAQIELSNLLAGRDAVITIRRTDFEKWIESLVQKTIDIVDSCIQASGITKEAIDEVVIVGGSTRIPLVRRMLQKYFGGKLLNETLNPDEAVAQGAAFYAQSLLQEKDVIEDVTSLSLGTDVKEDQLHIIIPRNTPIPTKQLKKYCTLTDNQGILTFPIYQGESSIASQNHKLGEFQLTDLTPAKARSVIATVILEVDKQGILSVTAFEDNLETSNVKTVTIDTNKAGLSQKQILEKTKELKKYKDDLKLKEFNKKRDSCKMYCEELIEKAQSLEEFGQQNIVRECKKLANWLEEVKIENENEMERRKEVLKKWFELAQI